MMIGDEERKRLAAIVVAASLHTRNRGTVTSEVI